MTAENLLELETHKSQKWITAMFTPESAQMAAEVGEGYAGFVDDKLVGVCGVYPIWDGRGVGWAFFAPEAGKCMRLITRMSKEFLDLCTEYNRVECTVDVEFEAGHKWAKLLEFKEEGVLRKYLPNGNDVIMYSRVK